VASAGHLLHRSLQQQGVHTQPRQWRLAEAGGLPEQWPQDGHRSGQRSAPDQPVLEPHAGAGGVLRRRRQRRRRPLEHRAALLRHRPRQELRHGPRGHAVHVHGRHLHPLRLREGRHRRRGVPRAHEHQCTGARATRYRRAHRQRPTDPRLRLPHQRVGHHLVVAHRKGQGQPDEFGHRPERRLRQAAGAVHGADRLRRAGLHEGQLRQHAPRLPRAPRGYCGHGEDRSPLRLPRAHPYQLPGHWARRLPLRPVWAQLALRGPEERDQAGLHPSPFAAAAAAAATGPNVRRLPVR